MGEKMTDKESERRVLQSLTDMTRNASMSVGEWCAHRRISRAMLYKLWKAGAGPAFYHVGTRRFISAEADAEWIRAREAEAASTARDCAEAA